MGPVTRESGRRHFYSFGCARSSASSSARPGASPSPPSTSPRSSSRPSSRTSPGPGRLAEDEDVRARARPCLCNYNFLFLKKILSEASPRSMRGQGVAHADSPERALAIALASSTAATRLLFAPINRQSSFKISALAIHIYIQVIKGSSPGLNRSGHNFFCRFYNRLNLAQIQFLTTSEWIYFGQPKRFIGINVANSAHNALI